MKQDIDAYLGVLSVALLSACLSSHKCAMAAYANATTKLKLAEFSSPEKFSGP